MIASSMIDMILWITDHQMWKSCQISLSLVNVTGVVITAVMTKHIYAIALTQEVENVKGRFSDDLAEMLGEPEDRGKEVAWWARLDGGRNAVLLKVFVPVRDLVFTVTWPWLLLLERLS